VSTLIHPTALVDTKALLGEGVRVGPYCVIEGDVQIGDGCDIGSHVQICSGTHMGNGCCVFKGANIGAAPQDLKFGGERTLLKIGDNTTIREFCTLNRGTKATGETVIGSNCLFMAYCHIAHDCRVGDHLVAANSVNVAGHVEIGHHVNIGGITAITQFRKIGDYCHISVLSSIIKDIVPFAFVASDPMRVIGINRIGLKRAGFDDARRRTIQRAYKLLFRSGLTLTEAIERLGRDFPQNPDVEAIIAFAKGSTRGLLRMGDRGPDADAAGE
jgi:UDP-N-acetylglucosamine acyltransferase